MSPLGKYAQGVAAVLSLAIVLTWLVIILFGVPPLDDLTNVVLLALGYVFGRQDRTDESVETRKRLEHLEATSNAKTD